MTQNLRRWLLIGSVAALLVLPVLAYTVDNLRTNGEVARNVSVAGVQLGGLGEEDATAALREYESELANTPAIFEVEGEEFELQPSDIDLQIDEEALVDEAMQQRRDKNFVAGFFSWFGSFGDEIELDAPATLDAELLDDVLKTWEREAIDLPAYEGGLIVRDTRILPDYPRPGEGIDRTEAEIAVLQALQTLDRTTPTVLETTQIEPELTNADIDNAVVEATRMIDAPVTLSADDPEVSVTFSREQLAAALETQILTNSEAVVDLSFNPDELASDLLPLKDEIEQPPRDAEFDIDTETKQVTLLPSRPATVLDVDRVADALVGAAASASNSGSFPFGEGTLPSFSTEDAQALGNIQFVSEFTTSHPAGQARVTNIHLMADTIDGAIVMPGDEFSINEYVGERTADKGYVPAPMILGGELVDDVGGGVSQFATTFFNAVFYGCYEDVEHKPHSYYFSRYPEVNEATISWPAPNLIFRNNTDAAVIIKTAYTDSDITVQFYGDNGGCEVERVLGNRYAFTDPPEQYVGNPDLTPLDEKVTQNGFGGFSNTVMRIMTWPDGTSVEEEYKWRYSPEPKIIEVHPCNLPPDQGGSEDAICPVQVPSVIGGSIDGARAALEAEGFTLVEGPTLEITDESQNGLIVDQSPNGGDWVEPGTAVTVRVGVYVPPEEG